MSAIRMSSGFGSSGLKRTPEKVFAGAFRRSELVGLDVEDCVFSRDGLTVTLRKSKTDQTWEGRRIGIPYGSNPDTCPVRTIQAWIEQAAISASGPLFRSIKRH